MPRTSAIVRDALPDDAPALMELWGDALRRTALDRASTLALADARAALSRMALDGSRRIVVAEIDGSLVGAAFLILASVHPLHADDAVHVTHLQVSDGHRKHGVGRALMDAALTWSEENGCTTVFVAAAAGERDANRFFARLGLGQIVVIRGATVAAVRSRIPVEAPTYARTDDVRAQRSVGQTIARRRSQRRSRT